MKLITLLLVVLVAAFPAPALPAIVNGIAAVVNDEPITLHDVDTESVLVKKELEKTGNAAESSAQKAREVALNRLIDKKLIDQKIKELNIQVSEEEVRQSIEEVKKQNNLSQESLVSALTAQGLTFDQYRAQFKEQLERLRLMSQEVRSKIQISPREISEYYAANPTLFGGEEMFRARQIFFKLANNPPAEEVKRVMSVAAGVLNEARSGKDFGELAKQYSDDPRAAEEAGDLGAFKKGELLPEIDETVARMQPGDISDLVITPAGLHIIKLEKRYQGSVRPLEVVKAQIEEMLYKKKSDERFTQWLDELRKSAAVEIKEGGTAK